jgi:hypothetical protein
VETSEEAAPQAPLTTHLQAEAAEEGSMAEVEGVVLTQAEEAATQVVVAAVVVTSKQPPLHPQFATVGRYGQ